MLLASTGTDELLARSDARAARDGRSRSDLIREAVAGYLQDDPAADIGLQIVESSGRDPQHQRQALTGLHISKRLI
jgi:Ribbon-helix-helix protein, copG family